jgi:hypothetical protein
MILFSLFLTCSILISFVLDTLKLGITPTSTSKRVREAIFDSLPHDFEGKIVDLGSGFGDFAVSVFQNFESTNLSCYEEALIPYWISKIFFICRRCDIQLIKKDFLEAELGSYDLVFCYLYRKIMPTLWEKLQRELKPGSWVISHTFAFEGIKAKKVIHANDLYHTPIYFYQV